MIHSSVQARRRSCQRPTEVWLRGKANLFEALRAENPTEAVARAAADEMKRVARWAQSHEARGGQGHEMELE